MELDKTLFQRESTERLEIEIVERARMVMGTDHLLAISNLFGLIEGYATHLAIGMSEAGFRDVEAETQGWQTAWSKLRSLLDKETDFTNEVAAYLERNLGVIHPTTRISDFGEPLDPATRTFYRTFIGCIEHPAVHPTAIWLFRDD